jgi:acetylornithine deacetylase/succinyl-diaminopimelate desuccinylase-like protein/gamma-glutamyl:cysteine ligase YbdK (ATP-grasp superfamily)
MDQSYRPEQFAEKYQLALEAALKDYPHSGVCGLEMEWNLLDSEFRPLLTVGSGPSRLSIVDHLRAEYLPPWLREFSQLEIFHWMIEWATRPYYSPRGAVYEGRLQEAVLLNTLERIGNDYGEKLYAWHGNLPAFTRVDFDSIPRSWDIAKRRYLERCVTLYGDTLATAGIHSNLSLPEPLLAWDFMHLAGTQRASLHLDGYKNEVYVLGTRLMRAFCALFIATGASTPLQAQVRQGRQVVVITDFDSVRNLTFPNPTTLDLPELYRTHRDYLQISAELVRQGVRFGNNNWTPVRARSFAEPVERLIAVTSDQLAEIHARGLYAVGEPQSVEELSRQIEIQNLLARINLPMNRVEVRTDDGGGSLDDDIANLTLKYLLLLRFYADDQFARNFRYDREDLQRARRNEDLAARYGLKAEIENPLTGKPIGMRQFLSWVIEELRPLAVALNLWEDLHPLIEMAQGAPNPADRLRARLRKELHGNDEIPISLLRELAEERKYRVARDVETIAERMALLSGDNARLAEFLHRARDTVRNNPQASIRFRPRPQALIELSFPDKTSEILHLAQELIQIPSVTASPQERLEDVQRAASFIYDYLRNHGLPVQFLEGKYPAIYAALPRSNDTELITPGVMLGGHFDVVEPEPDDSQFEPRIEGNYLWGRGSADMKTVVATYLVWLKDLVRTGPPYPPVSLLLVGNEENGEAESMGTPFCFNYLHNTGNPAPGLYIAGERTGEKGDELWGEICVENRGVMRFEIQVSGARGHTGVANGAQDLSERLILARTEIHQLLARRLTLVSTDGWKSQVRFPYIQVGTPGIFNITPDRGLLGVEIRSIPQDRLETVRNTLQGYCDEHNFRLDVSVMEDGVACDLNNRFLVRLIRAVESVSGEKPRLGKKLPGTSARFAPGGQGIVWGQSGLGPHAADERHYIPSILPYYRALEAFGKLLLPGSN